jgi:flagellar biosynthesis/type III secretory pathway protein FliH
MPIIVNVEDIDLLRQPIDEAFAKGEARGLEKGEARGLEKGEARGLEKGEARGFEKGEARGLEKGEARGLIQALTLMLTAKFGALPKDAEERLAALRPIDVAALIERTASAVKLKDVLGETGHSRRRPKP